MYREAKAKNSGELPLATLPQRIPNYCRNNLPNRDSNLLFVVSLSFAFSPELAI